MSVVEPDPVQAAEAGIDLPTAEQEEKERRRKLGQPVESGVEVKVPSDEKEAKELEKAEKAALKDADKAEKEEEKERVAEQKEQEKQAAIVQKQERRS